MRWYSRATILTQQSFLHSQYLHTHNSTSVPKFMGITSYLHQSSPCAAKKCTSFLFSSHQYAAGHSYSQVSGGKDEDNTKKIHLQIISEGRINPAAPTPYHLRTFKLSIIDQIMFDFYTPRILFFPNTDRTCFPSVSTRSRRLKESLSKLLTRYYPFAGEIKDNFHIECNDKGVYYVEAQVSQSLEEFLHQPDDQIVRELIPKHPSTTKTSLGNYVLSVQVNIFKCGGIGLCTSLTHKIADGHTYFTFMNAWAAATRGSSKNFSPSFLASEVFPYNPSLKYSLPSKLQTTKLLSTKRFVFSSMSLASLKAQPIANIGTHASLRSSSPTRSEAITALVWKASAKAASMVRPFRPQSPHILLSLVNIRKRASPPLPKESVGNLIVAAVSVCFPNNQPDLPTLMGEIRESIAKINSDFIEPLKGENGHKTFNVLMRIINDLWDPTDEGNFITSTSLLNSGMYKIDFGWGNPIWSYHMNPGSPRFVSLNDIVKGGGVEAIVTLSSEEMEIFECDPEVLSYATLNPSPLSVS